MKLSEILTKTMEQKGISSYKLSKETGISDSLIGYYRTGKNDPSAINLLKISDFLDISVDYLLGRCSNPNSHKSL